MVFAETFTNPLMRALDLQALSDTVVKLRQEQAPKLRLVVDNTIATPWGVQTPYPGLARHSHGRFGWHQALGGEDKDMWGYIASNIMDLINPCMDMQAMRGGILSWRCADVIYQGLEQAQVHLRKGASPQGKSFSF